jgi:hypothetical protein
MRGKIFLALALIIAQIPTLNVQAEACPALRFVFARGSGETAETDQNFREFKQTILNKMKTTTLSYDFVDLDYPAIGIGDIGVLLGAAFSAGEGNEFGESVKAGVDKLISTVNNTCPGTKFVLGGYSQGAMVISKALPSLNANKIIYAATFGDPKTYLPEGSGLLPPACRGEHLSDYRAYVPDCKAYKGLLGGYVPYEPSEFTGKLGTWCNKADIFCSHRFNITDHVSYVTDGLYEDASRMIYYKVALAFGITNTVATPHDTAILIDSTGSMANMIEKYKAEALRLARETLDSGGRVALYDYRDLDDPYEPVKRCDFNTCTLEIFEQELSEINASGGGDIPESLLSASFHMMKELTWKRGATKSVVVLTDADFLSPDRDGMSFDEVVALSKSIDPVNFYIITNPEYAEAYEPLANATDGKVVTNFDELSLLTDYIMERFDSLPRVEEEWDYDLPEIKIDSAVKIAEEEAEITWSGEADRVIVVVGERVLGTTSEKTISISGLSSDEKIGLVPITGDIRGEYTEVELDGYGELNILVPLAPNTGRAQ